MILTLLLRPRVDHAGDIQWIGIRHGILTVLMRPDDVLPRADHAGDIQRVGIRHHGCDNAVAMTLTLS